MTNTVTSPRPVDTAAGFGYAWNVTKDGNAFASATTANFTFTPDAAGTYVRRWRPPRSATLAAPR